MEKRPGVRQLPTTTPLPTTTAATGLLFVLGAFAGLLGLVYVATRK